MSPQIKSPVADRNRRIRRLAQRIDGDLLKALSSRPPDKTVARLIERIAQTVTRQCDRRPVRSLTTWTIQTLLPFQLARHSIKTLGNPRIIVNVNVALVHNTRANPLLRLCMTPDSAYLI